jgi:hypothetical protein
MVNGFKENYSTNKQEFSGAAGQGSKSYRELIMMRSRTPTLTQSIDLKQTTDKDLKVFVRPAKTIKNPFLMEKFTVP